MANKKKHSKRKSNDVSSIEKNSMWGGRFGSGPTSIMEKINASINFDKRLYKQDITASKVHSTMLVDRGIISTEDGAAIAAGLETILDEIENNSFEFSSSLEDIHLNIESRLSELIGDPAGRLHTARSRNDQVATDFRLWIRDTLDLLDNALKNFQEALISRAEENINTIMPGYTHLQNAQPVTLAHHLLAYVEMMGRDRSRAKDCRARLNECPLGSGALAGTAFPIDRNYTAKKLGFDSPMVNSIDSVSDRDFVLEFLSFASIVCIHLSRLSEEIVLWSSPSFNFISLPDSYSTGSSMLPQKRNPDAAELVRAKAGKVIGALNGFSVVMKGLPLAYSKDMQEDKEPVFETADTLELCLHSMTGMMSEIVFHSAQMRKAAEEGKTNALDLADWIVQYLGKPFREAHLIAGSLVKLAEAKECGLEELSLDEMQTIDTDITDDVFRVLNLDNSVNSRISFGGTAPANVKAACVTARKKFL